MSIKITTNVTRFSQIFRGKPFACTMTLYSRTWEGKEEPKEYLFYKVGKNKAVTVDKRTVVHFLSNSKVNICTLEQKKKTA